MELKFLTRESITEMKADDEKFIPMLISENRDDITSYLVNNNHIKNTGVSVDDFTLTEEEDFSVSDLSNTILLYSKMKNIPMRLAADERLWAWLTVEKFWDYIYYRRKGDWRDPKDNRAYYQSFFYTYGPSRSQVLNTVSRLWWAGYYTYDENRADKYELTKFYLKNAFASNILLLQSSKATANKDVRLGLLDGLKEWLEVNDLKFKRKYFVEPVKYLNIIGGVALLDFYDRQDIHDITLDCLRKKFENNVVH